MEKRQNAKWSSIRNIAVKEEHYVKILHYISYYINYYNRYVVADSFMNMFSLAG